jgi:hypothetical protein
MGDTNSPSSLNTFGAGTMSSASDSLSSSSNKPTKEKIKSGQKPCNTASTVLYQSMIMFLIPLLASIYCMAQLIYRGLMGIEKMLDFKDMEHVYRFKMVSAYALFWFFFFIMLSIFIYLFTDQLLYLNIISK